MSAVCSDCAKPLAVNPRRKGTRCVACAARHRQSNLSAGERAAIAARCSAAWNVPGYRERVAASASEGQRRRMSDPAELAKVQANCRRAQSMRTGQSAESRRKISRATTEQYLGWCPVAYRPLYRSLVKSNKLRAAEAREAVFESMRVDLRRLEREHRRATCSGAILAAQALAVQITALRGVLESKSGEN